MMKRLALLTLLSVIGCDPGDKPTGAAAPVVDSIVVDNLALFLFVVTRQDYGYTLSEKAKTHMREHGEETFRFDSLRVTDTIWLRKMLNFPTKYAASQWVAYRDLYSVGWRCDTVETRDWLFKRIAGDGLTEWCNEPRDQGDIGTSYYTVGVNYYRDRGFLIESGTTMMRNGKIRIYYWR